MYHTDHNRCRLLALLERRTMKTLLTISRQKIYIKFQMTSRSMKKQHFLSLTFEEDNSLMSYQLLRKRVICEIFVYIFNTMIKMLKYNILNIEHFVSINI